MTEVWGTRVISDFPCVDLRWAAEAALAAVEGGDQASYSALCSWCRKVNVTYDRKTEMFTVDNPSGCKRVVW